MRYIIVLLFIHFSVIFCGEEAPRFKQSQKSELFFIMPVSERLFMPSRVIRPIIVFDFGGVIGGTDKVLVAEAIAPILDISMAEAQMVLSRLRVAKELGISQERFWKEYEAASGKPLPDNWEAQYEEIRRLCIRANPQMLTYVDCLRQHGYRVAMLSNTTKPRAAFIRDLGLYHHFEPVVLSCDIGVKKPIKEAFILLLGQLGASAGECIMVDDKPENIDAARRLGIDGIVFTSIEELAIELEQRGIHTRRG